jgi:MYXO-CTERM domain-containing protein
MPQRSSIVHNKLLRNATVGAMLFGGTLGAANAGLTVTGANINLDVGGAIFATQDVATAMAGGMAYDATSGGSLTLSPFTSTGFNLGANSAGGAAMWSVFEFLYTFTANSNMNAVLSGDTAAEGAVIVMLDNTNLQTMFLRVTGDATAWNSVALALVSGHNYTLVINPGVVNGSTDTGTVLNFAVTAVPAPGAAALVGVAGLVAGRRRRA